MKLEFPWKSASAVPLTRPVCVFNEAGVLGGSLMMQETSLEQENGERRELSVQTEEM